MLIVKSLSNCNVPAITVLPVAELTVNLLPANCKLPAICTPAPKMIPLATDRLPPTFMLPPTPTPPFTTSAPVVVLTLLVGLTNAT